MDCTLPRKDTIPDQPSRSKSVAIAVVEFDQIRVWRCYMQGVNVVIAQPQVSLTVWVKAGSDSDIDRYWQCAAATNNNLPEDPNQLGFSGLRRAPKASHMPARARLRSSPVQPNSNRQMQMHKAQMVRGQDSILEIQRIQRKSRPRWQRACFDSLPSVLYYS